MQDDVLLAILEALSDGMSLEVMPHEAFEYYFDLPEDFEPIAYNGDRNTCIVLMSTYKRVQEYLKNE